MLKGSDLPTAAVLHLAAHSERELNAVMDAISAAVDDRREHGDGNLDLEGASISSIELSIQSNAIVFHDTASTATQRATIARDFGPAVVFDHSQTDFSDVACTGRTNCGSPIRAGLQLYKWNYNGGYPVTACMSAFVIKDLVLPPHYFGTSAGHCFDANSQGRYHPSGTYLGAGSSAMKVYGNGADVMRFTISAAQASNLLYISSTTMRSVTSTDDNEVIGEQVCSSKLSGVDCGYLLSRNVCSDGGAICGLRHASYQYACSGDSGSPVYMPTGATTARAQGIIQGKSSGTLTCPNSSSDHMGSSSVYSWI